MAPDSSRTRWDRSAHQYAAPEFTDGADLERALAMTRLRGDERLLDVATGVGAAAGAFGPRVGSVVVADSSTVMVETARQRLADLGIETGALLADALALPLADASFDVVTCRIAPHHFPDVRQGMAEMHRVLRPDGTLVLIDSLSPDDSELAAFLDKAERLRDPTHVRSLTRSEWERVLERVGFLPVDIDVVSLPKLFEPWLARGGATVDDQARVRAMFRSASRLITMELGIARGPDTVVGFADEKIVIRARRI